MARTRDWRRAQFNRYVQRVIKQENYFGSQRVPNPLDNINRWWDIKGNLRHLNTWQDVFEMRRSRATIRANVRTLCSCYMCGNPRRHYGDKTMQEKRFEQSCNAVE